MIRRAFTLAALAMLTACAPSFRALNAPPPLAEAELCDGEDDCRGDHTIRLTKGVALAVECITPQGDACTNVSASADDGSIVTAMDGYLDTLTPAYASAGYGNFGAQPRSALVIIGHTAGETTLTIRSDQGSQDFDVTVIDF